MPAEEPWVYADPAGKTITVPAAPLSLGGNGGCAYYGLHDVQYASSGWNVMLSRSQTTLDKGPAAAPEAYAIGSKRSGTWARVYPADDQGEPLNELGYIHDALLRSARLVSDSGLHHLRWTRE